MRRALRKRRVFDFVPSYLKYPKSSKLEVKAGPERFTFTALTTDEVFERLSKLHT